MSGSLTARKGVSCTRSSRTTVLRILFMDERTIPPSGRGKRTGSLPKSPRNQWGEDFHYRALFEQTGECVFIIGLDLRYITANQQALSLLGYEESELVGMPVDR